jgi:hypothetical protein
MRMYVGTYDATECDTNNTTHTENKKLKFRWDDGHGTNWF